MLFSAMMPIYESVLSFCSRHGRIRNNPFHEKKRDSFESNPEYSFSNSNKTFCNNSGKSLFSLHVLNI